MRHDESVSPDDLRADLRHFADLIVRLDADGKLLDAAPHLLKLLGDLRAKIFAYEVRFTRNLTRTEEKERMPAYLEQSRRIVEEAIRRAREAEEEWRRSLGWDDDPP